MSQKTSILVPFICLFCLLVMCSTFPGCGGTGPEEKSNSKSIAKAEGAGTTYKTKKIMAQKISDEVRAIGTVRAYQEVQISPEISGKIKKIHCSVGDRVKRGDLLVEIDDELRRIILRQKKALLKKAEATSKKARKDAQKGVTLFKEGVISDSESDDSELGKQVADAELDLARADVMKAEKELRDTKIVAPFDGKVALEEVEIGKMVTPGENLLTLVDITKVKILVTISELDIAKLSVGSVVAVVIDSLPERHFPGKVETVGLKADDVTRTFPMEIVVLSEEENLLSGMVARVTITSKEPKEVIIIPKRAVRTVKGIMAAYVMNQGKVEQRRLYLGKEIGEQVIVEKGLVEGDTLIVSGDITPGMSSNN
jgi:membrane fusion protein (multidrug efflux system)